MQIIKQATCEFCNEIGASNSVVKKMLLKVGYGHRIIHISEHSFAIAGLGALTPGYVLLLPRRHCNCLGQLSDKEFIDFLHVKSRIGERLINNYGSFVCFEHGATSIDSLAGSCYDHAHLHMIPDHKYPFRKCLKHDFEEKKIESIFYLKEHAKNNIPYFYLDQNEEGQFCYTLDVDVESQYMRRLWALFLGKENEYNWAEYPIVENMIHTINTLRK